MIQKIHKIYDSFWLPLKQFRTHIVPEETLG
jgi:hypothetical protein